MVILRRILKMHVANNLLQALTYMQRNLGSFKRFSLVLGMKIWYVEITNDTRIKNPKSSRKWINEGRGEDSVQTNFSLKIAK